MRITYLTRHFTSESLTNALRQSLAEKISEVYRRFGVDLTSGQKETLDEIETKAIFQVVHGCMIPHLGVYKLVLEAARRGTCLFFCHDLYEHDWYPEVRALGFYDRGKPPGAQDKSIAFRLEKGTPVRFARPPSKEDIGAVKERLKSRYVVNIRYSNSYGASIGKKDRERLFETIDQLFGDLAGEATTSQRWSDFTCKYWLRTLKKTNPEYYDRILFCPVTDASESLSNPNLDRIIAETEHMWYYDRRYRRSKSDTADRLLTAPDIVGFEALTSGLDFEATIVGGVRSYFPAIDALVNRMTGAKTAERVVVSASPVFYGIGIPSSGSTRASIIQAVIEVDHATIGRSLLDAQPALRSKYLPGPHQVTGQGKARREG